MGVDNQVWYLERQLFEMFPESDRADYDNCGVLVGNKDAEITGIAVTLDASIAAVDEAADSGCNVLFTHHPVFQKPPYAIIGNGPGTWSSKGSERDSVEAAMAGPIITEAIKRDVALLAMHTNFDVSARSQLIMPEMLGLTYLNPIEQTSQSGSIGAGEGVPQKGMGQLSSTPSIRLEDLARRCKEVFGGTPRVWGNKDQIVELVGTCPGSAWPLINDATRCEFDAFITGEVRYHTACAARDAGIGLIELGHDVSEAMFVDAFYDILIELGYDEEMLVKIPAEIHWWSL